MLRCCTLMTRILALIFYPYELRSATAIRYAHKNPAQQDADGRKAVSNNVNGKEKSAMG